MDGNGWDIVVLGKCGKLGTEPITNAVMNALAAYGKVIGLGGNEVRREGHVIFQPLGDGSWRVKMSKDYARQPMSETPVYCLFMCYYKAATIKLDSQRIQA